MLQCFCAYFFTATICFALGLTIIILNHTMRVKLDLSSIVANTKKKLLLSITAIVH